MTDGRSRSPAAFQIFPVVNSRYAAGSSLDVDDAEAEAARIAELLARWGGAVEPWDCDPDERHFGEVEERMTAWSMPDISRSSVLLWIGHGQSNDQSASLTVRASTRDVQLHPEGFAKHIECEHRTRSAPDWAIVVVEACGGARFVQLVGAHLLQQRADDGVLLIGTGADRGRGYLGNFRRALEQVQAAYSSNDTVITLSDLGGRIEELLESSNVFKGNFRGCSPVVAADPARPTVTTLVHWYPDLRRALDRVSAATLRELGHAGTPADLLEVGGYFTGRADERARIQSWLEDNEHGVLALAGLPGTGKSALLANLVLNAVPGLRTVLDELPFVSSRWPEAERLPRIDGAIPLIGMRGASVITRIAQLASVDLAYADGFPARSDALVAQLRARRQTLTLVADALDEARDPREIATLLGRISALPRVRVIVSTRQVAAEPGLDLISALRDVNPEVAVVGLARDARAMSEFAEATLKTFAADIAPEDIIGALADISAAVSGDADFLRLKLLINELLADRSLLTDAGALRRRELTVLDRAALFEMAFARIVGAVPEARALLTALASTGGRGLPRADRLWTTVAAALEPGRRFTEADVQRVLDVAGPYIMLDAEDGRTVYRLAHRAFSEQLLPDTLASASQLRVLRGLLGLAHEMPELSPYLAHHLSGHAAAAGPAGWSELAASLDVLDGLDLSALSADTWKLQELDLPAAIRGVLRTAHLAALGAPEDRRGYRELGTVRTGSALDDAGDRAATWRVLKARLVAHPQHLTVPWSGRAPIRALTVADDAHAQVLVAGDDRGRIATLPLDCLPENELRVHATRGSEVLGLADAYDRQGRRVLVSVSARGQARVWRAWSDEPAGRLSEFGSVVTSCIAWEDAGVAGRELVAIGTAAGRVSLWHVDSGRCEQRFVGHRGRVAGVVAVHAQAGRRLVSAGRDRSLRVWDPARRTPAVSETEWGAPWCSVAWLPSAGQIVAGDESGRVSWWSLDGLQLVRYVSGHRGAVNALAVSPASEDAPEAVVSAGQDGAVRVWDAATGAALGPDLTGHHDAVTCLAVLRGEDGRIRIASGSRDATIRVWRSGAEPLGEVPRRSLRPASEPPQEWRLVGARGSSVIVRVQEDGSVECRQGAGRPLRLSSPDARRPRCVAAFTREDATVLATVGHDGVVRTWSMADGAAVGPPLAGHDDWVQALTTLTRPDAEPILVSGGDDGLIVFWEPITGVVRHRIRVGAPIRGLVAVVGAHVDLKVVLDEGELVLRVSDALLGTASS